MTSVRDPISGAFMTNGNFSPTPLINVGGPLPLGLPNAGGGSNSAPAPSGNAILLEFGNAPAYIALESNSGVILLES